MGELGDRRPREGGEDRGVSDESRAHLWQRLIDEERDAFERAERNAETAGPSHRANLAREWFAASARLLIEHRRSHVVVHEGGPLQPYPGDAIARAAKLMESLSAGRLPQPVTDATAAGGRPDRWPGERRDLASAVHYLALAKRGAIADRAYNVTVAEAFGVDRTTVQSWWRERQRICEGIPETPVGHFPDALRTAGARYHFNRTGERTEGVE